jgi:EAL domain-containing protein (putative c-di-GMP-specific phosphodiesterase class I)
MTSLKNQGVRVTLARYGAGHSSLGQLWALPFDKLKLDGAFVEALDRRPEAGTMIRAINGLGKALNLSVAADGVATEEQMKRLAELGCETGQGSLFGSAQPSKHAAPVREPKLMITAQPKPAASERAEELEKAG